MYLVLKLGRSAVGKSVRLYSREKHKVIQKWLEDSFNLRVEIVKIVKKALVDKVMVWMYLVLDLGVKLTRRELLEVSESCNLDMLKKLAAIITYLNVIDLAILLSVD